jgi:fatty-acyl-CoA synthase
MVGKPCNNRVCAVAAPLTHVAGTHAFCMLTLGATLLVLRQFDAREMLETIRNHLVTHLFLPPTCLYMLLNETDDKTDCSSLRSLWVSAASVSPVRLREAVARFGPCIGICYGQVEAGFLTWLDEATIAASIAGDRPERLRSTGTTLYTARIAVMADNGELLEASEVGDIVVRGNTVRSYINDVAETRMARRCGWHHTGDIGYLDEDGYLYIVGRMKDVIITGGLKVPAAEVEQALMENPCVLDCAVVGVADPKWGEAITAVVSLRPGWTVEAVELMEVCRKTIGSVKAPKSVEIWNEIPRTPGGKIDKRSVRLRLNASLGH